MEAIATQLGVHHSQIVRDLREFVHDAQIKKSKSATNPKGAGRPKGSKKQQPRRKSAESKTDVAASLFLDQDWTREQVVAHTGLGEHEVQNAIERERGRRDPQVDPSQLSLTAQQKFNAAIRAARRGAGLHTHRFRSSPSLARLSRIR